MCVNAYTTYIDVHTEHAFMLRAHNKSRTFNWSHIELMYIFTLRYFHFRQPHDVVFSCLRSLSRSLYLWAIHPTIVHIFHYDYVLRLVQTVTDEPINYFFRNSIDDISTHYTHTLCTLDSSAYTHASETHTRAHITLWLASFFSSSFFFCRHVLCISTKQP